ESIEKIVSWTRENIKFNWTAFGSDLPKGILEYKEASSACSSYSTLITAFSRASGIPARVVAGGFAESGPGHEWVEAYANGEWVMVYSTGYLESNPEEKNCLHSVYTYDQLNDRVMDVSLSYNREVLNLVIEHTKDAVGETSAIKQAETIFTEYEKETDLAKKYAYAQEIMDICISEVVAKESGYESEDIKVLDLWDWDKLKTDEAFLSELEKAKVISVYDVTAKGFIQYRTIGTNEFPLEKINTVIPDIKELFQGEIYFFFAHYKADCDPLSDVIVINLFDPEDVDTLETAYQDLLTGTTELLKDFVIEIDSVVSKEKDSTNFHLPEYIREGTEYSITTSSAWDMENTAWNIFFHIQSIVTIQDIVMVFRADQTIIMLNLPDLAEDVKTTYSKWRGFDNLKLINKEGKVYVDPEIYRNPQFNPNDTSTGVPYDCAPSSVFISPGQTLEIYSEDDLVIIKGDMTTEHTVIS
ncbi:MAG: transglutaminase-like domain-containing protein, partial [Nanoarchaeota archaeon]